MFLDTFCGTFRGLFWQVSLYLSRLSSQVLSERFHVDALIVPQLYLLFLSIFFPGHFEFPSNQVMVTYSIFHLENFLYLNFPGQGPIQFKAHLSPKYCPVECLTKEQSPNPCSSISDSCGQFRGSWSYYWYLKVC